MPRFVILRHETPGGYARPSHWDFMLQHAGTLKTWAILQWPREGQEIDAEELPDHRLAYLDYEGEISGRRGSVRRVEQGTFEIISSTADRWQVRLCGGRMQGVLSLTRSGESSQRWSLTLKGS